MVRLSFTTNRGVLCSHVDSDGATDKGEIVEDEYVYEKMPNSIKVTIADSGYHEDYDYDLDQMVNKCWFNMDITFDTENDEKSRKEARYEKTKKKSLKIIDQMIANVHNGISGFFSDDEDGCINPNVFPRYKEDIKHGEFIELPKVICPYQKGALYSDGSCSTVGCYHKCCLNDISFAPTYIKKNILTRYRKALVNDAYKKVYLGKGAKPGELPKLITDGELEEIKKEKARIAEEVRKENQRKEELWNRTNNEKRNNCIIFNGNNLNPIPEDLFGLWNRLKETYNEKQVADYSQICDYKENKHKYIGMNEDFCEMYYYDYSSSIGMSLYHDYEKDKDMFLLVMSTDGEGICTDWEGDYVVNRNEMYIEAYKSLKKIYRIYKSLREQNQDKWHQIYKVTNYRNFDKALEFHNSIVCETCLFTVSTEEDPDL
jgi:hypothetical protein